MKIHHLAPFALAGQLMMQQSQPVNGHGFTIFVNKCDDEVSTSCCDLSNAPDSEETYHKEPDFGRTIFPNEAFSNNPNAGQIYVADLGVDYRASVWDATNPECADGEGDDQPPSPCWRFEPDGSDFPAFTPFRCSLDDSFNMFSINIEQPLEYWNGREFVPTPNGERLRIYGQDWPEPSVLEEPNNPLGAGKWAAVLGASTVSSTSSADGIVLGADVPTEIIEWTSAGNAKDSDSPYSFESHFEKDLSWGADPAEGMWGDTTAGYKWGDHEHYLYRLVDVEGEMCVKTVDPPSVGGDIGADTDGEVVDDCADGVYHVVMSVSVDGNKSAPIQVLFARGVDMTGPAMQGAYKELQMQHEAAMQASDTSNNDAEDNTEDNTEDNVEDTIESSINEDVNNSDSDENDGLARGLSIISIIVACIALGVAISFKNNSSSSAHAPVRKPEEEFA